MAQNQKRSGKKITKNDAEKLLPFMRKFNAIAKEFNRLMHIKIQEKERRIAILITDVALPNINRNSIKITTLDMGKTEFIQKGKYAENRKMDWEKNFRQNKGTVI